MNFRQPQVKEALTALNRQSKLGPKFVPTEKRIPFMGIITATEPVALNLECQKQMPNLNVKTYVIFLTKIQT